MYFGMHSVLEAPAAARGRALRRTGLSGVKQVIRWGKGTASPINDALQRYALQRQQSEQRATDCLTDVESDAGTALFRCLQEVFIVMA